MIRWVSEELVLLIHRDHLQMFGGSEGIRDHALLDSALNRPIQKANFSDPTVFDLAAAYCFGIARNHPFVDGNKRTALMVAYTFLGLNGFDLVASQEDAYRTILSLAAGEIGEEELTAWFEKNSVPTPGSQSH